MPHPAWSDADLCGLQYRPGFRSDSQAHRQSEYSGLFVGLCFPPIDPAVHPGLIRHFCDKRVSADYPTDFGPAVHPAHHDMGIELRDSLPLLDRQVRL